MSAQSNSSRVDIEGISVSTEHFIGGKRVASPQTFEVRSPLDWDWKLADMASGDANTANAAIEAACEGFLVWSRMTPAERGAIMRNLADQIDANIDDAVQRARSRLPRGESLLDCEECGATIPEARRRAVPGVRLCIGCQQAADTEQAAFSAYNRRGSKDSQLR